MYIIIIDIYNRLLFELYLYEFIINLTMVVG